MKATFSLMFLIVTAVISLVYCQYDYALIDQEEFSAQDNNDNFNESENEESNSQFWFLNPKPMDKRKGQNSENCVKNCLRRSGCISRGAASPQQVNCRSGCTVKCKLS